MPLLLALHPGRHRASAGPGAVACAQLLRLVLPVACAGCGALDEPLCRACLLALPRGGVQVEDLMAAGVPPTWAAGVYGSVLQRLLLAFKDDGRHDLLPVLGACLAGCVHRALHDLGWPAAARGTALAVVPVPSSRRAVRRRGADVTAALARDAASRLRHRGVRAATLPVLRQRRGVRDQAGLSVRGRAENLAGALRVRGLGLPGGDLAGLDVLVVDDVVTTGATLAAAASALAASGARVLGAATVAATPRLHPRPVWSPPAGTLTVEGEAGR